MDAADRERAKAWAKRIAASLPPFTPEEAAEVGRLAAIIDARRHAAQTTTARRAA